MHRRSRFIYGEKIQLPLWITADHSQRTSTTVEYRENIRNYWNLCPKKLLRVKNRSQSIDNVTYYYIGLIQLNIDRNPQHSGKNACIYTVLFPALAHPILKSPTPMISIPWSHRGTKPLALMWGKENQPWVFLLDAQFDFSHAWYYINKIPLHMEFVFFLQVRLKDFSESLLSFGIWGNVLFPCYHRHLKHWQILTFPALFLWHSTVAVSGHNVLGALAKVLQLTVHRFSDIPWHELGTFCLVTCNCRYWFGNLGLLSRSTSYASY